MTKDTEKLEEDIVRLGDWWVTAGQFLKDDFAGFPAQQPAPKAGDSTPPDPIPERLCYMFFDEACGQLTVPPPRLTHAECTPRWRPPGVNLGSPVKTSQTG
jgi:hypothetical protein